MMQHCGTGAVVSVNHNNAADNAAVVGFAVRIAGGPERILFQQRDNPITQKRAATT